MSVHDSQLTAKITYAANVILLKPSLYLVLILQLYNICLWYIFMSISALQDGSVSDI